MNRYNEMFERTVQSVIGIVPFAQMMILRKADLASPKQVCYLDRCRYNVFGGFLFLFFANSSQVTDSDIQVNLLKRLNNRDLIKVKMADIRQLR